MVSISEWLPNPVGKDAGGEWVELVADKNTSLGGYALKAGKTTYPLSGSIHEGEYLVLKGMTLGNTSGTLVLIKDGQTIEQASFLKGAPEGKSISKVGQSFVFTDPTPGAPNQTAETVFVETPNIQEQIQGHGGLIIGALGVGLASAFLFSAMMRRYAASHNQESEADGSPRQTAGSGDR
jgi:hypothetical protein